MTISLLILYSLLYYFSLFIDWVDQATLGAHILLEWANDSLTRASIHFRQSSIVRSLYRITTSEYSMFLPLFGVLAYIVCHFSKTLLDHYTNQWLGFFSGLMQDHLSDACDTALGIAPRYARTYSENLFYWQCSGERSGVAHRAELWTTLINVWRTSFDSLLVILFVLLLWAIWWYNSGNEGRLGNENNETPAEQKPQRAVIELTDNVDNQSSRGGTLKETTLKENELDATAGDDVEAAEEATSKFDCHDISIETFEENTTSPVALVEPIEPTRPLPRGAKKAVQNASNRKSQFCRMRGEVCGCADCEAEEHAVKMAWKYRKTIKKLKAELEARSSIAKSMRAEEHQKYQGRIAVLEAALADAENDVDAAYNEPMIGPDRSANHTSAMTMRLQLRKALHQNELLEKKRDDDSRKLQKILKDLENAQRTISDLKEATIISNNEIDSRDEKIKALLKEAEAVKGIRRTMEDEITHQKRQLQAAEETHREACESISRGSKDLQQTWAEKSKEDETTQEKLRKSIEYLRSSLRDADASQKISQTTIDNLRTTLTIVEASNAEHVRELTKTRQTAEALEKGYKFEISGLKGLLEERQTQGTLQTQTYNPAVNEGLLQRINALQAENRTSEEISQRKIKALQAENQTNAANWLLEATRLEGVIENLTIRLNEAASRVQSVQEDCVRRLEEQKTELHVDLSEYVKMSDADRVFARVVEGRYVKTSDADQAFANRKAQWDKERLTLIKERDDAISQVDLQESWSTERADLIQERNDAWRQVALLAAADSNKEDNVEENRSPEKILQEDEEEVEVSKKKVRTDNTQEGGFSGPTTDSDQDDHMVSTNDDMFPGYETAEAEGAAALAAAAAAVKASTEEDSETNEDGEESGDSETYEGSEESEESDADDDEPKPKLFSAQSATSPSPWPFTTNPYLNPSATPSHHVVTKVYNANLLPAVSALKNIGAGPGGIAFGAGPPTDLRRWTRSQVEKELNEMKVIILKRCKEWRVYGFIHMNQSDRELVNRFDTLNEAWDVLVDQQTLTEDMLSSTDIFDILFAFKKTEWRNPGGSLLLGVAAFLDRVQKSFHLPPNEDCAVFYIPPNGEGTLITG